MLCRYLGTYQYLIIFPYLRCTIEEAEEHEERVVLTETGRHDANRIHKRYHYQHLLPAYGVCHGSPEVGAYHHP